MANNQASDVENLSGRPGGMIERIARALAPTAWAALGTGDTLAQQSRRTASLRHARKAVAAMREPTEVMVQAGLDEAHRLFGPDRPMATHIRLGPRAVWPVMIDTILADAHPMTDAERDLLLALARRLVLDDEDREAWWKDTAARAARVIHEAEAAERLRELRKRILAEEAVERRGKSSLLPDSNLQVPMPTRNPT